MSSIKKKLGSGKTFYIQTYCQIDHLRNIFNFDVEEWEKSYEYPNNTKNIFSYFKYVVIRLPCGSTRLDALIQFSVRKTANSTRKLFADVFGIFKLHCVERVHNPLVIATMKLKILQEKSDLVVPYVRYFPDADYDILFTKYFGENMCENINVFMNTYFEGV